MEQCQNTVPKVLVQIWSGLVLGKSALYEHYLFSYGELQKYVEFLRFFSRRRYMDDLSKREIS